MTYDDWKLRSDRDDRPEDEPVRCIHHFELDEHCPVCDGSDEETPMTLPILLVLVLTWSYRAGGGGF